MQEPSPSEEDCDCSSTVTDEIPSIHLQEIDSIITLIKIDYDLFTSINSNNEPVNFDRGIGSVFGTWERSSRRHTRKGWAWYSALLTHNQNCIVAQDITQSFHAEPWNTRKNPKTVKIYRGKECGQKIYHPGQQNVLPLDLQTFGPPIGSLWPSGDEGDTTCTEEDAAPAEL